MTEDERYMARCLQLAKAGLGRVQPNPMVGAVIVHDGRIIGEDCHHRYGEPHAEANAMAAVKDPELLRRSTLYVNLEPCSHYGKNPPCADAVVRHHIPKVVVGIGDCNDKVNGNGIRRLREAGIDVVENVLKAECAELNRRFFTFHTLKRPYVILKWAQTADGFMDIDRRDPAECQAYWITNPALKVIVHKWRGEEDAVIVGYNTMKNDRPLLTVREYPGKSPQRFVMQRGAAVSGPLPYSPLPLCLTEAMAVLYGRRVQSVIVEGGRKTLELFLENGLWDEARILVGSRRWGKGMPAPAMPAPPDRTLAIGDNLLHYVRRHI